jgi:hypothetical protein
LKNQTKRRDVVEVDPLPVTQQQWRENGDGDVMAEFFIC